MILKLLLLFIIIIIIIIDKRKLFKYKAFIKKFNKVCFILNTYFKIPFFSQKLLINFYTI